MEKEIKRKFVYCFGCGEYKGKIRERYVLPPHLWSDDDGSIYVKVSCICEGPLCSGCKKNRIPRPISESYNPLDGKVWHNPWFTALRPCNKCRNKD